MAWHGDRIRWLDEIDLWSTRLTMAGWAVYERSMIGAGGVGREGQEAAWQGKGGLRVAGCMTRSGRAVPAIRGAVMVLSRWAPPRPSSQK